MGGNLRVEMRGELEVCLALLGQPVSLFPLQGQAKFLRSFFRGRLRQRHFSAAAGCQNHAAQIPSGNNWNPQSAAHAHGRPHDRVIGIVRLLELRGLARRKELLRQVRPEGKQCPVARPVSFPGVENFAAKNGGASGAQPFLRIRIQPDTPAVRSRDCLEFPQRFVNPDVVTRALPDNARNAAGFRLLQSPVSALSSKHAEFLERVPRVY